MASWFEKLSKEEQESIKEQIAEDTCKKHNRFCCPECFNMQPYEGK